MEADNEVAEKENEGIEALSDGVHTIFTTAVASIQQRFEIEIARLREETLTLRKEKKDLEEEKLQMSKTLPLPKKVSFIYYFFLKRKSFK